MATHLFPALGLLSGAVAWGLIWYPYRLLEEAGVRGDVASFYTYCVALALGLTLYARRLPSLWAQARATGAVPVLAGIALATGWANLGYVLAVVDGEVMRVLLLFYLAPLWTVLFAHLLLGERASGAGYGVIALSLGGAALMLWEGGWPFPRVAAEWIGLSAGVSFALGNVLARRAQDFPLEAKALGVWVGVAGLALLVLLAEPGRFRSVSGLDPGQWLLLLGVGVVLFGVTLTVLYGLAHTPANRAVVIFLFELVVAAASSYFWADEALSGREWLGAALIVAASLFSGRLDGHPGRTPGPGGA